MKTPGLEIKADLSPVVEMESPENKIQLQKQDETGNDLLKEVKSYIDQKLNNYQSVKWKMAGALNSINIYCDQSHREVR